MTQISTNWVTTVEACAILNKSEAWLRIHTVTSGLERTKVGQSVFYRREQIERLAKELQAKSG